MTFSLNEKSPFQRIAKAGALAGILTGMTLPGCTSNGDSKTDAILANTLANKTRLHTAAELVALKSDPSAQLFLVERSHIVPLSAFRDLANETVQLAAIKKLPISEALNDKSSLQGSVDGFAVRASLINGAHSDAVIAALNNVKFSDGYEHNIIWQGDPTFGTIVVLDQIHEIPDLIGLHDAHVARSQRQLLRSLVQHSFAVVLAEGFRPVSASQRESTGSFAEKINSEFDSLPPGVQRSANQLLQNVGAAELYSCLPNASECLNANSDSMNARRADFSFQIKTGQIKSIPDSVILCEREADAMNLACKILKENPGKTIALIYGAGHLFDMADLPRSSTGNQLYNPRIESVSTPGLIAGFKYNGELAQMWVLIILKDQPEKQLAFLESLNPKLDSISLKLLEYCNSAQAQRALVNAAFRQINEKFAATAELPQISVDEIKTLKLKALAPDIKRKLEIISEFVATITERTKTK